MTYFNPGRLTDQGTFTGALPALLQHLQLRSQVSGVRGGGRGSRHQDQLFFILLFLRPLSRQLNTPTVIYLRPPNRCLYTHMPIVGRLTMPRFLQFLIRHLMIHT